MYKAILVEDEVHSRKRLDVLLKQIPEVQLLGEAENGFQGLELVKKLKPDLVFLDIQMPGMNGFEFIQQLDQLPMIIFTTAYDHYALQAFDTLAIDYLLKPVTLEQLQKTFTKISSWRGMAKKFQPILSPLDHQGHPLAEYLRRFSIRYGSRWVLIDEKDVVRFFSSESLTYIVPEDGVERIVSFSLQDLDKKLDPEVFLRVHRSVIISIAKVKDIKSLGSSRFQIVMKDGASIETSRSYCENIRAVLLGREKE